MFMNRVGHRARIRRTAQAVMQKRQAKTTSKNDRQKKSAAEAALLRRS